MSYSLSPLPGQSEFGVVLDGFEIGMIDDPQICEELRELWIDKGLIVFRETDGLETQMRLSEVFGKSEIHPLLRESTTFSEVDKVSVNIDEEAGGIYEVNGETRLGWLAWHKDSMYTEKLNHGGLLWAITVPEKGGETGFIDQIAAYDALPGDLKRRIEGCDVLYVYSRDSSESRFGEQPDRRIRLSAFQETSDDAECAKARVIHPMVFEQPQTGRKVINVSPWFADGILGMENEEGDALLREVISHLVKPDRTYYHRWVPGEMVLWDNWRMLHCATGTPPGMKRHMRRTTIFGDYALGRLEELAAA